jgi:hypothetical protein
MPAPVFPLILDEYGGADYPEDEISVSFSFDVALTLTEYVRMVAYDPSSLNDSNGVEMTALCYEIVTYLVKNPLKAEAVRVHAKHMLTSFPGFIDWVTLSGSSDDANYADLVVWGSAEAAKHAANAVETLPEFSDFREMIDRIGSIGHYQARSQTVLPVQNERGIEIGRFRLKPDVSEAAMREAYTTMVNTHLAKQPGWLGQHLVQLEEGVFVDIAYARDQQCAKAICATWQGQAACEAFLLMIDPESMEFGRIWQP